MDHTRKFNKPPPGFSVPPNIPPLGIPPPNIMYNAAPPFGVPPPNFNHTHPATNHFNVPPPMFSAPPPNWTAGPPPNFQRTINSAHHSNNYNRNDQLHNTRSNCPRSVNQQNPASHLPDHFRYPPPKPSADPKFYSTSSEQRSTSTVTQNLVSNRSSFHNNNSSSYRGRSPSSGSYTSRTRNEPSSISRSHSLNSHRSGSSRDHRDSKDSSRDRRDKSSSRNRDNHSDRYDRSERSERSSGGTKRSHIQNAEPRTSSAADDSQNVSPDDDGSGSERNQLLTKWRSNYCEHYADIERKLSEMNSKSDTECWIRSSPSEYYYERKSASTVVATARLDALCSLFHTDLVQRGAAVRAAQPPYVVPPRRRKHRVCRHKSEQCSSSDSSDDDLHEYEDDCAMEELTKKIQHPHRLHPDLWHNEAGEMNDGPLCRCSVKSKRSGIRHGIYPGEKGFPKCDPSSNNSAKLHHYRITISPPTNFLTKTPTIIHHDQHEFIFEGFSMFSHSPISTLPTCKVIRFNIEYTILYIEEKMPENFTIKELDLFYNYLFIEVLELVDLNLKPGLDGEDSCPIFHFLPRFVRNLSDNGKEVLAMAEVLRYLLDNSGPLIPRATLVDMMNISQNDWQTYVDSVKDMVVINPGKRPCSVRVDQLDRNVADLPECIDPDEPSISHPVIVHFGIRPPQLSYAGNPDYQKAWREYVKFRHLVANMPKPTYNDKHKLKLKETKLQEMRTQSRMKRNITIAISSKGFFRTGIMCDIVQHAMLIPVLATHLRFHSALDVLEQRITYTFQNRYILQLALTHPSYKENFGTNPDHARNSLTNCGIRQPEYGDRKIHYLNTRKRGINTLINIMSRFGKELETDSNISHNERLEFLGDAVVEFITSIHLYFMFPELEEGGLATYRAAIVENQHLAVLAKKFQLEEFMLYAHGSDLCHELELRHAMANCFEALMGSLLLDGGIKVADKVFSLALFKDQAELKKTWDNLPPHPLQEQEPLGDRQWIDSYKMLQELVKFEDSIGIKFRHIRILARAFTDRSIGYTHLTMGSNQRLEFLGDTVLQFICSEYLYRHFPEHHEGHLSLLRSSLVNNKTQAVVCDDLGMTKYAVYSNSKPELKTKDRADLLEAFLGAMYVDRGLDPCEMFCQVCLFPRLQQFIMNQDWNDPKSKLQQCCLTLRTMDGSEPDIPIYKVIECLGPTNTRVYTVAVYFRGKRLASSNGHSIQQAEMNAAKSALDHSRDLFPQLDHQKRVISNSIKRQKSKDFRAGCSRQTSSSNSHERNGRKRDTSSNWRNARRSTKNDSDEHGRDESNLPKQYRTKGYYSDESSKGDSDDSMKSDTSSTRGDSDSSSRSSNSSSSQRTSRSYKRSPKSKKRKSNEHNSPEIVHPQKQSASKNRPISNIKNELSNVEDNLKNVSHENEPLYRRSIGHVKDSNGQPLDINNTTSNETSQNDQYINVPHNRQLNDSVHTRRISSCSSLSSEDESLSFVVANTDATMELSSDIDSVESGEIFT